MFCRSIPLKTRNSQFYLVFTASHRVQYQKNLLNRFREKFKKVDFGPKNSSFTPFWECIFSQNWAKLIKDFSAHLTIKKLPSALT